MTASATTSTGLPSGTCTGWRRPRRSELLTLKALRAIQSATVLLVDDLVSKEIVDFASPPRASSTWVSAVAARAHPRPLSKSSWRLKYTRRACGAPQGGDPFIFGRGGEEVEHLRRAGIEPQIINGITAGLAGLSSLGAPLTHREHAHGVVFITGHAKPGDQGTDWRTLAATVQAARLTLVIYMGVSSAEHITAELQAGGLPAHTPAAIIQHASLPQQRHAITTLEQLAHTLHAENLASPSVLVIGDVVQGVAAWAQNSSATAAPLRAAS